MSDAMSTQSEDENRKLRRLLALSYSGVVKLYRDDGECSDSSERPFIDFMRDPAEEIERKMVERGMARVSASPPAADPRVAEAVKALDGLLTEAKESAGDIFHDTWNPDAHVELTLTIAELRGLTELRAILTAQAGDAN
jgi:hypothetical protein